MTCFLAICALLARGFLKFISQESQYCLKKTSRIRHKTPVRFVQSVEFVGFVAFVRLVLVLVVGLLGLLLGLVEFVGLLSGSSISREWLSG